MNKIELKRKTILALRWTSISSVFKVLVGLIQLGVLARLLPSSDYGVMAIATMVTSFASVVSDFGIGQALIQRKIISDGQRSSLYWLSIIFGAVPFCIMLLLASPIANFYKLPEINNIIWICASTFLFNSFGQQIRLMAEKDLKFGPIAIIEMFSAVLGFLVSVCGVSYNFGVYSLAIGAVSVSASTSILSWTFLRDGWTPDLIFNYKDIESFVGFGGALTANNFVNQINMSVDLFLGGRILGVAALGLYSVPRNFVLQIQFLINPIVMRVGFPLLAKVQDDKLQVKKIYLKTLNLTSSLNAPIHVMIFFHAREFMDLFLGVKWIESGALMSILALWAGLRSTGNTAGGLIMGMGRADLLLKWNLWMLILNPVTIWVGSFWGGQGMAVALFLTYAVLFVPCWSYLIFPLCGAGLAEYSLVALRPFVISLVCGLFSYGMAGLFEANGIKFLVGSAAFLIAYVSLSYIYNKEFIAYVKIFAGRN